MATQLTNVHVRLDIDVEFRPNVLYENELDIDAHFQIITDSKDLRIDVELTSKFCLPSRKLCGVKQLFHISIFIPKLRERQLWATN